MLLIGWILVFQIHVNIGIGHFGILGVVFHVIVLFIGRHFMLLLARGFVLGALQSRIFDGVNFGYRRLNFFGFRAHEWWSCVRDER